MDITINDLRYRDCVCILMWTRLDHRERIQKTAFLGYLRIYNSPIVIY